jgi:hypothetical protein
MTSLIKFFLQPGISLGFKKIKVEDLHILKINIPDPANLEVDFPTVYAMLKTHNQCNMVIFSSTTEVFNYEHMKILTHNAYYVNNFRNILFYDNGYNQSPIIKEWAPIDVHHIQNTVTNLIIRQLNREEYNEDQDILLDKSRIIGPDYVYYIDNMLLSKDRNTKFVCLNKAPRVHRVRLVEEILSRGMEDQGVVSCGYDSINVDYSKICIKGLQHKFPLQVETTERITNDDNVNQTLSDYNQESIITVVAETSCEQVDHPLMRGGFDKIFITEKTLKAFITGTFPLILGPKNVITYLRNKGFDMFDDIIDHSYDNYADPNIKIKMIVDQLEKLIAMDLETLQNLHSKCIGRFNSNRMNSIHFNKDILDKREPQFQQYISNIT